MPNRASGSHSVHWQEQQKQAEDCAQQTPSQREHCWLPAFVCLGQPELAFLLLRIKRETPALVSTFAESRCLPCQQQAGLMHKQRWEPPQQYWRRATRPALENLPPSNWPEISPRLTNANTQAQTVDEPGPENVASQGRLKAREKRRAYHPQFVNWFTHLDSLEWPGPCPPGSEEVKSLSRVQLFATRWTVAYQASPSMGFSRQEYWSGLLFPSPGDLPNPGIEPGSPVLEADALTSEPTGKPS